MRNNDNNNYINNRYINNGNINNDINHNDDEINVTTTDINANMKWEEVNPLIRRVLRPEKSRNYGS
jgi:hypothetical protein